MEHRHYGNKFFVRLDKGEEIITQILQLCKQEKITLAEIRGLGAVDDFSVGLFDVNEKKYYSNRFQEMAEITSLWGTVTTKDDELYPHIHMSVATRDGKVLGGHLNFAKVSATCEMVIYYSEGTINRKFNDEVGLNLFDFKG